MTPERLYQELGDLAEKLGITVCEHNLRKSGLKVKSGLCRVKGKALFIMDKHKSLSQKIDILAEQLAALPLENVYLVPAVRELLERYCAAGK